MWRVSIEVYLYYTNPTPLRIQENYTCIFTSTYVFLLKIYWLNYTCIIPHSDGFYVFYNTLQFCCTWILILVGFINVSFSLIDEVYFNKKNRNQEFKNIFVFLKCFLKKLKILIFLLWIKFLLIFSDFFNILI